MEMPLKFASLRKLPNADSKLHKTDSAVMPQRMPLPDRRVAAEQKLHEHGAWSCLINCTHIYEHHKSGQWLVFGKTFKDRSNFCHCPRHCPAWTKSTIAPCLQATLHGTSEQCCRGLKHYLLKSK